jgi:hypothetical protein
MKAHESVLWGVHISGPDTVKAAHSFSHAVEKAGQINQSILDLIATGSFSTELHPIMFANIFIWPERQGEHDPENTDWDELC